MIQTADNWKDYKLLDAGDGEKLELWGKVKVIRPDPQAFWQRSYKWEKPDMHYHRSKSGGGSWETFKNVSSAWQISYGDLRFVVRPTGFKHMGLFPEQAVNWDWLKTVITPNTRVLNLFAYTGGATVACLNAGADVTHIDAAKGMNSQARENINLSNLDKTKHRVMTDDVIKFVQREMRRGNKYDGIIMDPPVFGRGPSGEMWRLEEKLCQLVENCFALLSSTPRFFLINAYTAGFSPTVYGNILEIAARKAKIPADITVGEIGLTAESGIILPCGMFARCDFMQKHAQ